MIEFNEVTKQFAGHRALDRVSFHVDAGELAFLVGPSGSGKTTILRLLTREIVADAGGVLVGSHDLSSLGARGVAKHRRHVAYVPQDHRLLANRSVAANLQFSLAVCGWRRGTAKARIDQVLDLVGLPDHGGRLPAQLSGGERQRVVIARAVASLPDVLLADEPTGNLDPTTSVGIVRLLDDIAEQGTTVIMSTHDSSVVDAMRRRVIALSHGHVTRHELTGRYGASITTSIPGVTL